MKLFGLVFVIVFGVYLVTLCPTVYVGDSGELITAGATLGIAHPPGYPTYTILSYFFSRIPLGNIAFRINLMSAVFAGLAVAILFLLIRKITNNIFVSFCCALIFAFSDIFWAQAVSSEVYTLNAFFVISTLYFISSPYIFSFLFGLSLGNHNTMFLLAPVYFWHTISQKYNTKKLINILALIFLCAAMVYFYLPIRSLANPTLDWGNPENIKNFIRHITRMQYGDISKQPYSILAFTKQIIAYLKILVEQYNLFLLAISVLGIYIFSKTRKREFYITLLIFLLTSAGFAVIMNFSDNYVSLYLEKVFFIPSFAIVAIWFGAGISFLIKKFYRFKILIYSSIVLALIYQIYSNCKVNDLSKNVLAYNYGKNIVRTLDNDSILFTSGDNATFILKYMQAVENIKPAQKICDDNGVIFKNIYGDNIYDLPLALHNEVIESVQKNIALQDNSNVYFVFGGKLQSIVGISYKQYGVLYRVSQENLKRNKLNELNFSGINKIYYDHLENDIIAQYHYFFGESYIENNREKAILEFRKALEIGKNNSSIKSAVFDVASKKNFLNDLSEDLLDSKVSGDVQDYNNQGNIFLGKGEYDKAIELYKKALNVHPKYAEAYNNLGLCYMNKGDFNLAIDSYYKSLSIKPSDARVYSNLGVVYFRTNNFKESIKVLEKAVEISPGYDAGHYNLANALLMENLIDKAIEEYKATIKITKNKPEVYNNLGIAYERKRMYREALNSYKLMLDINPNDMSAKQNIARLEKMLGK
ncbi:MAG: tetratricopeptide repeat protein [Candidatus Firestonebacteria bacterium]